LYRLAQYTTFIQIVLAVVETSRLGMSSIFYRVSTPKINSLKFQMKELL
jgi:hypothetical protein